MTRLWAISDLHVGHEINRRALLAMPAFGDDWLILAGDVGETAEQLDWALTELSRRFGRLFWTPGNHELWSRPGDQFGRGEERYRRLVDLCRRRGCRTPEDAYEAWPGDEAPLIAPIFTLYDYSFRPKIVACEDAVSWAAESGVICADEALLDPYPYKSVMEWCAARVAATVASLEDTGGRRTILISHFPLRHNNARLPGIPRFSIWCGTTATEFWPWRFNAMACIYGHLHIRVSHNEQGCRFEEVSLGYPGQWAAARGIAGYLRLISTSKDAAPFDQVAASVC